MMHIDFFLYKSKYIIKYTYSNCFSDQKVPKTH